MWLLTNFAVGKHVATWRCGDHTVSNEMYYVAHNLPEVWESRFCRDSFWQRVCGNIFACLASCTAPQCTPCDHSCWNGTIEMQQTMRILDEPHMWPHLICISVCARYNNAFAYIPIISLYSYRAMRLCMKSMGTHSAYAYFHVSYRGLSARLQYLHFWPFWHLYKNW